MQVRSSGVQISGNDYTWFQTWRFFTLGLFYTVLYALIPVGVVLWHNHENYSDPIDWSLVWKLVVAAAGPAAFAYYREKKALLKIPPFFQIPPEFNLDLKQVKKETTEITELPANPDGSKTTIADKVTEKHFEPIDPTPKE